MLNVCDVGAVDVRDAGVVDVRGLDAVVDVRDVVGIFEVRGVVAVAGLTRRMPSTGKPRFERLVCDAVPGDETV